MISDEQKEKRRTYLRSIDTMIRIYGDANARSIWLEVCKTTFNPSSEYGRELIAEDDRVYTMINNIATILISELVK